MYMSLLSIDDTFTLYLIQYDWILYYDDMTGGNFDRRRTIPYHDDVQYGRSHS